MASLTPVREAVEKTAVEQPDLRDCFLCHAWNDRQGAAKELYDALVAAGVKVWFSEKDLGLGEPMMRSIDRGLANSKIGLVLVTPNFITGLPNQGVADKELSALLAGNRLVPIVHQTSYTRSRRARFRQEDSQSAIVNVVSRCKGVFRLERFLKARYGSDPSSRRWTVVFRHDRAATLTRRSAARGA